MSRPPRRRTFPQLADIAARQDGVVSRAQLRGAGVSRFDVRNQVVAGRWSKPGPTTVVLATGALTQRQLWRLPVLETGCSAAALDGVTALVAAGLRGYADPVTVSCPAGAKPRRVDGVQMRVTRWRRAGDNVSVGIPRVRPEVAAVHGALWARTDRQAALIVVMTVQQRLTTATRIGAELARIRRHRRRLLLAAVIKDVTDGAQALGELEFARLCRDRGLPSPSRQVLRRAGPGVAYLDVYFEEHRLVVEIDGCHHADAANQIDDALRQNELTIDVPCSGFPCSASGSHPTGSSIRSRGRSRCDKGRHGVRESARGVCPCRRCCQLRYDPKSKSSKATD